MSSSAPSGRRIRVLIVDDSAVTRRLLTKSLSSDPAIEVAGYATDGRIALTVLPQLNPDVMTLDIDMPELNGLKTLAAVRKTNPRLPIIMFSSLTEQYAEATLDALALGANDYLLKPSAASPEESMRVIQENLIPKIKALCPWAQTDQDRPALLPPSDAAISSSATRGASIPSPVKVVAIGVSTGGPNALAQIFEALPDSFPVPIVIVQHMPPIFTKVLAERLTSNSKIHVAEGTPGDILRPGRAVIAPGGFHMTLEMREDNVYIATNQDAPVNSCRPSVDVLFRSVASVYGSGTLAAVLTGMGNDGFQGSLIVRSAGGQVLAQDEATSVVWGMPRCVIQAGLADKILPIQSVADEIIRRVKR